MPDRPMRRGIFSCGLLFLLLPQLAAAEEPLFVSKSKWRVRSVASGAMMVSTDQLTWLAYDQVGLVGDLQLGYEVLPWLDVQLGSAFGVFLSELDNGGLAAPMLGGIARLATSSVTPYGFVDVGGAFTGAMFLPMFRLGIGLDIPIFPSWSAGPTVGFTNVIYSDGPLASTDAQFISLGLAFRYAPVTRALPRQEPPPPPAAAAPPRVVVVREPSSELLQLVDRAVPGRTDQVELLAPVLFAFDSDELEPVGVAMLHEVARALGERSDLELIEIRAYSDARGSAEYNRDLAQRRGARVQSWLIEHGVEPARLTLATVGAGEFVEAGDDEAAHEQNRRVVFRVLRVGERK